jgi:hypothetical protein
MYLRSTRCRNADGSVVQYYRLAEHLEVEEVVVGDGERRRRYVVCCNPQEAGRQAEHRAAVLAALSAELEEQREPLRGKRHARRTCELLTTERYRRYLRRTPTGKPRLDRAAIAAEEKLDG